jgi:hypothetical protein
MSVGLAPCEIASVATTAMAGGDTALSADLSSAPPCSLSLSLDPPQARIRSRRGTRRPGRAELGLRRRTSTNRRHSLSGTLFRAQRASTKRQQTFSGVTVTVSVAGLVALIAARSTSHSATSLSVARSRSSFWRSRPRIPPCQSQPGTGHDLALAHDLHARLRDRGWSRCWLRARRSRPTRAVRDLRPLWGTGATGELRRRARSSRTEPL